MGIIIGAIAFAFLWWLLESHVDSRVNSIVDSKILELENRISDLEDQLAPKRSKYQGHDYDLDMYLEREEP